MDRGILHLIEALSTYPELQTLESCEGPPVWISFWYGRYWEHPWRDLSAFVFEVLAPLIQEAVSDDAEVSIHVNSGCVPFGQITTRPEIVPVLARALSERVCKQD